MTSSRSSRSSGNQPYNIRLNGSGPPPVSKANLNDPAAKLTNKLDNNVNYHQSSPTLPPNIKIVVMGGFGTGKTSLMDQFTEQHQPDTYRPTKKPYENEYKCTFTLDARRVYNLEVTDTEGLDPDSEFPRHLLPQDNRQFAYLIVFSVSHYGSFKLAENMLSQLVTSIDYNTEIPIVLVGNKSDIPTKRDAGYRFYTTDKAKTDLKQWNPEQERRHRLAFDFYDSDIHDEYRQVQQEEAWKLALKYNIKYKEVTAKCYADIVNVFVEVVTQNDKHSNHRRRMEIDNDMREEGKQCDFTSSSPQKRRKYFETMKLEQEFRMREYQTRLNLGNIDKNEFRSRKKDLEEWVDNLKADFNRMNSISGMSMYPHIRELHLIEGRGVREAAPATNWIPDETYPPAPPNAYVGRKSKDPSTSSEGRVDILEKFGLSGEINPPKNLTSDDLISKDAKVSSIKFFGNSSKKVIGTAKSMSNTSMNTRSNTSLQVAKHAEKSQSSSGKPVKYSSSTKNSKITASGDSKSPSKSSKSSKSELKSSKLSNCKNNTSSSNTSSSNDRSNNSDSNSNSNSTTLLTSTPRSSPLSSPSKLGNTPAALLPAPSSSSSKKSKKSKTTSSTKNSRTRTNNSTSSRPSPNGTRRRRSDSQGSFRTFSGVLDMFKNFPERLIGKVS
jgi:GTPase SAR1 family protein